MIKICDRSLLKPLIVLFRNSIKPSCYPDIWNTAIPLFTFKIVLSICSLKLSYSSSIIPRCFWWDTLSTWILLRLLSGWFWVFFFLENNTSEAVLLVSGLISIFQLKAHLEMKDRSKLRTPALSCLSLTILNREVSSAKSFALDFNPFGKLLI